MTAILSLKSRKFLKITSQLSIHISYRCIASTNAISIIKSVNTKFQHSVVARNDSLKYALRIFNKIETTPKECDAINAVLYLLFDWDRPEKIETIWNDIKLYHTHLELEHTEQSTASDANHLQYAMLMKLVIKSTQTNIDKCVQTLKWMERCNYKLSIHGNLVNRLINKCYKRKKNDINSLKYVHSLIDKQFIITNDDIIIKVHLINAYSSCGAVQDALTVFHSIPEADINAHCITALMKMYVNNGCYSEAFELFEKHPNVNSEYIIPLVIKACVLCNDLAKGKELHSRFDPIHSDDVFLNTAFIEFYGHFQHIETAEHLFQSIQHHRNHYAVSAMIIAYIKNGLVDKAMQLIQTHHQLINDQGYAHILKTCIDAKHYAVVQEIVSSYKSVMYSDHLALKACLIEFYAQCGDISMSWKVFRSIKHELLNAYSVNALLSALLVNKHYIQALKVYAEYAEFTDFISHTMAIKACIGTQDMQKGNEIIADKLCVSFADSKEAMNYQSIQSKMLLIEYFGCFGEIEKAQHIFDSMQHKDAMLVSAMMTVFVKNERFHDALELYDRYYYTLTDDVSHVLALKSCIYLKELQRANILIHDHNLRQSDNLQIKNALIAFYANSDEMETALKIFDSIKQKDIVTLNTMMDAYKDCRLHQDCIHLFHKLPRFQLEPDLVSFVIGIKACTEGALMEDGEKLHELMKTKQNAWMLRDTAMQINLINMYGKFRQIAKCEEIFDAIKSGETEKYKNDVAIWNAMIHAYAQDGRLRKVSEIYGLLMEIGVIPDQQTYVQLMHAFGVCGDVLKAHEIWSNDLDADMKRNHHVLRTLLQQLSQKGFLQTALEVLMQCQPQRSELWMCVLRGCQSHMDVELAQTVHSEISRRFGDVQSECEQNVVTAASVLLCEMYTATENYHAKHQLMQKIQPRIMKV